ncbi:hypothetical protein L1987_14336 [Smallanthus sonchifolius]|uniref:Uncharacterized protein n=1 Tax=Smallanthus sonchifolius TaxID=185202 RepID=A0ACB9J607_9ASTR|nr:hypothetical protein L1987_14336 [Smallanthus sonchifolius]
MSKSKSNQDEMGTSSSNTTLTWNATCRRSLRSSRGSKLTQANVVAPSSHSATGLKSDEQSSSNPAQKTAVPKDPTPGCGEEHKQFGEKCILCDKDLSCSPSSVDRADDEYKYRIKYIPQILPAVDILPCGHAIHTECSKHVMSAESNVPQCISCLSMP